MNKLIIIFFIVLSAFTENDSTSYVKIKNITLDSLSGYWSFNNVWSGDMGCAFKIDKDSFTYWAYSDFHYEGEPKYPISGKISIKSDIIIFNSNNNYHVYPDSCNLIIYKKQLCLFGVRDWNVIKIRNESIDYRVIYKWYKKPPSWPINNYSPEKPANIKK